MKKIGLIVEGYRLKTIDGKYVEGYTGLWESAGVVVRRSQYLGSYQGDLVAVLKDPDTGLFAYGHTGYGSCSGCDAFEGCDTARDYQKLRDEITDGLIWMTAKELADWLLKHDWKGDYIGLGSEEKEFQDWLKDAVFYLKETQAD